VDLPTRTVTVESAATPTTITKAVTEVGYTAHAP